MPTAPTQPRITPRHVRVSITRCPIKCDVVHCSSGEQTEAAWSYEQIAGGVIVIEERANDFFRPKAAIAG
jgi:hypothetical protein